MYAIIGYLKEMLVLAIPAAIIFNCFLPYRKKALSAMGMKSSLRREVALTLFVMVIFGVLAMTVTPAYIWQKQGENALWGNLLIIMERPNAMTNVNLIPFMMFKDYFVDITTGRGFFFTIINFFGNLAVFVPIGFFVALLFEKATWKRSFAVGLGMSFGIEVCQWFLMRSSDIDDIILNTFGAVLGYFVYLLLKKIFPQLTESFLPKKIVNQ